MTNSNPPPTPPTLTLVERLYAVHNINSLIPEKLDLAESNYSSWCYFFKGHCTNFGVLTHIEGSSDDASSSTPPTDEWLTADSIVKSWMFLTLSSTLRKRMIKANPKTAKAAWDTIETIFQDNKRTRTVALKGELRMIQMEERTAEEYFSKIDSISLPYVTRLGYPFPDLATVRSMVTTKEMRIRSKPSNLPSNNTSNAPQVLLAEANTNRDNTGRNTRERDTSSRINNRTTEVCWTWSHRNGTSRPPTTTEFASSPKFITGPIWTSGPVKFYSDVTARVISILSHLHRTLKPYSSVSIRGYQPASTESQPASTTITPTANPKHASTHSMVTHFRVGTNKPTQRYTLNVSTISPIPKTYKQDFNDPNWYRAMLDEYNALIKNNTWVLVPRPLDANIVRSLWLFRHKYNANGSLNRYKARLVANGSTQLSGIDVDETFSPVVKPATIRTVLSLAISRHWHVHQRDVKNAFLHEFSMTNLGPLNYFLGVSVTRNRSGMFLSQQKYASEVLERAGMLTCNPCRTPVDTYYKLSADGDHVSDPTLYRSLAGELQYLTFTRPDISYAVQQVCLFMHDPREPHFAALKRILRYVQDADWAGCPTTRRSTSWYCVFLGNNLLSWSSKRQFTLSRSSAEAEYRGVANAVAETCLRNLLRELHTPLSTATLVYCDNYADIFTKGLPTALFDEFRSSLSVRSSPAQTAGGCCDLNVTDVESAVGQHAGVIVLLPRIPLAPSK
ncbi:ribonuclease H-like domain-containing protein [Tanacetum coccineum]